MVISGLEYYLFTMNHYFKVFLILRSAFIYPRIGSHNAVHAWMGAIYWGAVAPADIGDRRVGQCVEEFVRNSGRFLYKFNLIGFTFVAQFLVDGWSHAGVNIL